MRAARKNGSRAGRRPPVALLLLASLLLLAVGSGCGSKPIPLVAVEGTTVTIAVPGNFPTGYGRQFESFAGPNPPYDPNSPLEDPQRGELVFVLYEDAAATVFLGILPLQYITRVEIAAPSVAGNSHSVMSGGQALAFVNVPADILPSGVSSCDCTIRVVRARRNVTSPDTFEIVSAPPTSNGGFFTGWGNGDGDPLLIGTPTSSDSIPIRILAGDGAEHFTPLHGWADYPPVGVSWDDLEPDLESIVPYPEAELLVPATTPGAPPAAWTARIFYPRSKFRIRAVTPIHRNRSTTLVRWEADDPEELATCSALPGVLKIHVIDPDRQTAGVRIAYQLRNFDESCGARATAMDFGIIPNQFHAYDENGVELTGAIDYGISAASFF